MSKLPLISFDASISNNEVGIGFYNHKNNSSKHITVTSNSLKNNTYKAEKLAFLVTLHYLKQNNIEKANLFTDSQGLYRNFNLVKQEEKFKNLIDNNYSLFWIPRELNEKADFYSKTKREGIVITEKELYEKYLENSTNYISDLTKAIKKYPLKQKYNLIKKLASSNNQKELVNYIINEKNFDNISLSKSQKKFLRFILSIISDEENKVLKDIKISKYQGVKISLHRKDIINLFKSRKLLKTL